MIIGGGVAGLCTAYLAKMKGHEVVLYEASSMLGGNMRLAAYPPGKGDITNMVRSYITKCQKLGVKVVLNTEVTLDLIKEVKPNVVVIATGAKNFRPNIEGIENKTVVDGTDILSGKIKAGKKVLIVGGGMVGSEIAAFLGEQQHEVSVMEFRSEIAADVIHEHKIYLMKDFKEYNIKQYTEAKVIKFLEDGVIYEDSKENIQELRGFDTIILSMGFRAYNPFEKKLEDYNLEYYVIGDAIRARRALEATAEAYEVVKRI